MKKQKQYRQGDVFLKPVASIPDTRPCTPRSGRFILAEGEATGHAHTICEVDGTLSIDTEGRCFLRTEAGCELLHQEHAPILVAPGNYEILHQREYSPEEILRVQD